MKMKGVLKGLRYIQQIFEYEEEPEMKIGLPTDVKHVGHIGWVGPTVNAPAWMSQFQSETDFMGTANATQKNCNKQISVGTESTAVKSSPRRRSGKLMHSKRRHDFTGSQVDSPNRSTTGTERLSNSSVALNSPGQDSPPWPPKSSRRNKSKNSSGEST